VNNIPREGINKKLTTLRKRQRKVNLKKAAKIQLEHFQRDDHKCLGIFVVK